MKRRVSIIIIAGVFVALGAFATPTRAQETKTEIEQRYELLQIQMVQLLEQHISLLKNFFAGKTPLTTPASQQPVAPSQGSSSVIAGNFVLPANTVCALRYNGSDDIAAIQQELAHQGFAIEKIDGKLGANTTAAVSAFQARENLKVDGVIGQQTRQTLAKKSVACEGDTNVSVAAQGMAGTSVTGAANAQCRLVYSGSLDVAEIQTGLKAQGYAIEKVDGKWGPNTQQAVSSFQTSQGMTADGIAGALTRKALARASVNCEVYTGTTQLPQSTTPQPPETPDPAPEPSQPEPPVSQPPISQPPSQPEPPISQPPNNPPAPPSQGSLVEKTSVTAGVRTTVPEVPDDTAVFTYELTFRTTTPLYVPTVARDAFAINVYKMGGSPASGNNIDSIISSGKKMIRTDGTSYFLIRNGDTLSIRTSIQPGPGQYYGELGRLTYTNDDAIRVPSPKMVNYGFDASDWRSNTVTVLN